MVRPYAALYVGGMGSREQNFYNQLAVRMGYADAAAEVQDLYLSRQACARRPRRCRRSSSSAPRCSARKARIAERIREYAAAGVGTLSVSPYVGDRESGIDTLRTVAEAYEESGVAE